MKLMTTTAVAALLALGPATAPLYAADSSASSTMANASPQNDAQTSDQMKSSTQQAPGRVTVSSAQDLIGHDVVDRAGENAGEVERLLINTQTGKISEVIVGSSDSFYIGDDLVAVPWHAIDATKSGEDLALRVPRDALKKAPRVDKNDFASLTEPLTITTIYDYYAPLVVADSNGQTNGNQKETSQKDMSQSSAQDSAADKSDEQMADNANDPVVHLLVGREVLTVVAPPALLSANEIKGTDVRSRDGEQIGEIDQVMIDVHRGQVAYLLIDDGGFLGLGEEHLPVPLAALDWSPDDDTGFVVDADAGQLKEMKSLSGYDDPAKIKGAQLAELYDQFKVQPYWADQGSNQTASTNG